MRLAIAQMNSQQGDFEKNLAKAAEFAKSASANRADLIVFPEMFLCGFNYKKNLSYLRENGNSIEEKLCQIARENSLSICGSVPHLLDVNLPPSNRIVFISSAGDLLSHYDKIHLFSLFNENKYVSSGNKIVVAKTEFGEIGFAVCYDIRFPELFVKMNCMGAKIMIVCAAFPHPRAEHWKVLCRARAIENQCFFVAVNRSGEENMPNAKIKYFGNSAVFDPWGNVLADCGEDNIDAIEFADLDLSLVDKIRAEIPVMTDRRTDIY